MTAGDRPHDQILTIDLTSDGPEMDMSISDNEDPKDDSQNTGQAIQPDTVEQRASPALSYMTLDPEDRADPEAIERNDDSMNAPEAEEESSSVYDPQEFSVDVQDSADQTSENEDIDELEVRIRAPSLALNNSEEEFNEDRPHGPISRIERPPQHNTPPQRTRGSRPTDVSTRAYTTASRASRASPAHRVAPVHEKEHPASRLSLRNLPRDKRTRTVSNVDEHVQEPSQNDEWTVVVPKAPWAKGRRLLIPSNSRLPMAAVYMRGDVQFIHQHRRYAAKTVFEIAV